MNAYATVLITGANGLLGQKLVTDFHPHYKVIACDLHPESFFSFPNLSYENLDITDRRQLGFHISFYHPQVIINAAAYTDVDGCEIHKDKARAVNVGGVRNLVSFCREQKIKLIQLSTDYIFNGENGPYFEEDPPDPVNFYGETKLESERIIKESGVDFLIIRTNVLYGFGKNVKSNFLLWLLEKLSQNEKIKIVTDQFNNPTLADNLSLCILEMVKKNISEIYHIAGSEYLSRYDFAIKVADKFNFDKNNILPTKTELLQQKAKRPYKGGLKIDRAQSILETKLLSVNQALEYLIKSKQTFRELSAPLL
ncbi:MAG: dTDP-4-dehydrorhamnose reductase [candidate division Zixibacteria bacterium]|nr:dTDP-4-dehydrorhamnose reductase [candidate division Zixibacteria bacterium]